MLNREIWLIAFSVLVGGVCMGAGATSLAQPSSAEPPIRFERLGGLSHNTVLTVLHGQRGFLWVGTADGLNRYDGYAFTVYRHEPSDSTTLSGNTVQTLAQDERGRLWVGTAQGLSRFDPETETAVRYTLEPAGMPQNVARVLVDRQGVVWASTYETARLYRLAPGARQFRRVPWPRSEGAKAATGGAAYLPIADESGRVWVTTKRGSSCRLHRYDERKHAWVGTAPYQCRSGHIGWGPSGTLWVDAEQFPRLGLASSGRDTVSPASLPAPPGDRQVRRVVEDRAGRVWVGTERGIFRYDPSAGALRRHRMRRPGTGALSAYVWTIREDRAGIIWVGTRSGLYRYDPHQLPFSHVSPAGGLPAEQSPSAIMAIDVGGEGELYLGTLGSGVLRLQQQADSQQQAGSEPGPRYGVKAAIQPEAHVWALERTRNRTLWVGMDDGVCRLDTRQQRCERYAMPSGMPAFVYALEGGVQGPIWLGGKDLFRVRPDANRSDAARSVSAPSVEAMGITDHVGSGTIQAIHQDPHMPGRLWLGTKGRGLLRYDVETGTVTAYPVGASHRSGLLGTTVWTIRGGARNTLWLGTDRGLVRFDPEREVFRSFYAPDVVPGSFVYSIRDDARGRLWLGTNQGLVRFDPHAEQFRHYGADDGVQNTEFNRRAAARGPNGRLYFGGLQGITAFHPALIRANPYVPPVAITQVTKAGRKGPVTVARTGPDRLVLDYRDRVFTIEFAALNFTNPDENQYAYMLDGFESDWVEAGTRRVVRYTNVPPGTYTFRVRGSNNDGVWNEDAATLQVTITPPFWKTWWFRLGVVAALVGAIVALYRARVAYLLRMERMRLRIASDLHDDVGSKLASVAITSDVLQTRDGLSGAVRDELERIGSVVRQTAGALRDIVWFVDPEHDDPEALLWKMKNEAATMLSELDYQFEHPSPAQLRLLGQLGVRDRRNFFLIYKEALHNVVRHAGAQAVRIGLRRTDRALVLTITDDGVGFDASAVDPGHGIKNMRRRAARIGAAIEWARSPEGGTTVRLALPLP